MQTVFISNRQILELPQLNTVGNRHFCCVFVWEHTLEFSKLEKLACTHYPHITRPDRKVLSPKRKIELLSVAMLIYRLFGPHVHLCHDEKGSPFLSGSNLYVSISHTHAAYAVSIATFHHGIDIEQWSDKAFKVKGKFLTHDEQRHLLPHPHAEQLSTVLWSTKESVFKCFSTTPLEVLRDIQVKDICKDAVLSEIPKLNTSAITSVCFTSSFVLTLSKEMSIGEK